MTDKAVQTFLAARGKTGEILVDYQQLGDDRDGAIPTFNVWNVVKLGPAPTTAEITAMQQADAQFAVNSWSIEKRAILLTILDQVNVLRQNPSAVLAVITPAVALAAARTKAGQLS